MLPGDAVDPFLGPIPAPTEPKIFVHNDHMDRRQDWLMLYDGGDRTDSSRP